LVGIFTLSVILSVVFLGGCSHNPAGLISEQYEYDQEGRLKCKVTPDGKKIKYIYNAKGYLTKIIYPDGIVRFGYDESGNRIWMEDKTGTTEYYYDAFDRLIGVIWKHSPWRLIVYDYDPWGYLSYIAIYNLRLMELEHKYREMLYKLQIKSVERFQRWKELQFKFQQMIKCLKNEDIARKQHWLEYEVKYKHDILGRLSNIDTKWGSIKYSYYPERGQVERRLPNGVTTRFTYSPVGLLKSLRHENNMGQLIAEYRYDYNAAGKVINVHELTSEGLRTTKYNWNTRGYLRELHLPDGYTIRYEYDAMGNRILQEGPDGTIRYEYDKFGRLLRARNIRYKWDRNGNLISRIESHLKTRIRYDGRGFPTLIRTPEGLVHYKWDSDGNIVSRRHGKEIIYYLSNPMAPCGFTLAEFNKIGRLTTAYLYGDVLLGQRDINGQMQYFLEDGFNSIRHITDMNGRIVGTRDYTPFAEPIAVKGNVDVNFRMAGERFLPEIKSYLICGRLYNPQIGRYLTPNPLLGYMEKFDSFNKYAHGCNAYGIFMEPRCNQTKKFNYWYEFTRNFFKGLPQSIMQGLKATVDFWSPSNILAGFKGGWEFGLPHPQTFAAQAEKYGGPVARKAVQSVLMQALMIELELATAGMLSKFHIPRGASWVHIGAGERAAHGALHLGLFANRAGKAIFHFYPSRLYIHNPLVPKLLRNVPYGLLTYSLPNRGLYIPPLLKHGDNKWEAFHDPFKPINNQLGGIKLAATGEFIGIPGNITGAVFDPEKECLVLLSDKDLSVPSIKAEDLAVALLCVFDPRYGDPQFSLDPANPRNPRGKWLKAVYIPEEIIGGTEFGKALFEADWLLKQYSFGVSLDKDGNMHERKSSVVGFKSTADLSLEQKDPEYGKERWARFWIVSDEMKLKEYANSIYFDVAKMRVKAKKQVPDPTSRTGLRDVDTDDPIATTFANIFTELYDEIAKESPEFERIKQLAKAVALAKWLKKEGIPVDMDWIVKYANKRIKTIGKITALSVQWERQQQRPYSRGRLTGIETITHQLHLFGGVDLTVKPKYVSDDGTARSLQEAVKSKLRERNIGPIFTVRHNEKTLQATVLPLTRRGQEMWKDNRTTEIDGITYQLNNQGEITKSIDRKGNITEYEYDANHKLKKVKISTTNGWKTIGEKNKNGSLWTVVNPRGNTFRYKYDTSGHLNEIEVDGTKWATYQYNPKRQQVIIQYDNYVEKVRYDSKGNIVEYEVQNLTERDKPERLIFGYNSRDNLTKIVTKIDGVRRPLINVSYAEDEIKPLSIITPQGKIDYSYDPKGRVRRVTHSDGISATYFYNGERLASLQVNCQGKQAEYFFSEDGIAQSKDFLDGVAKYGYTNGRLTSAILGQYGEAKYIYDSKNRLREIHFPNGNWVEYQYQEGRKGERKRGSPQGQIVRVVTHSSSPIEEVAPRQRYETKDLSLKKQLEDDIAASRTLKNCLILDLYVEGKDILSLNIVDSQGNVKKAELKVAKEFRKLLNITSKMYGSLGRTLSNRWENFYNTHLAPLVKPITWRCPDGREVKLKPILLIKSNEVNYKYANLEKVPILQDNFLIFIASEETSVEGLAMKINNIPNFTKDNVVFAIRLPKMRKDMQKEWKRVISELRQVVGKENVLFNPSKEEFDKMLRNRGKEIIVIELTHTNKGIVLKGNKRYTSKDVSQMEDLSHIKYLVAGPGTCCLARLEEGNFVSALRKKGVGITNASYREISSETALKRLRELVRILKNIERYNLPPYRILDIIDQLLRIYGKGTTNLGKLDHHKDCLFG
jgi:YD repeat-containing protein